MRTSLWFLVVSTTFLALVSCSKTSTPDQPGEASIVAWAVGSMDTNGIGTILHSADAGETWVRQGDSTMFGGIDISNVWAIDSNNAWIVCSGNRIFRTIDGGVNWIPVLTPYIPGNPNLCGLSILNNTTIWVSGENGTVYSSTDAGNNWTVYDSTIFRHGMMQGIHAISENIIYVAGELATLSGSWGFLARTLNGGTTWDSITLPGGYNQHAWIGVTSVDSSCIVVYGQTGHYSVSRNGGNTWTNGEAVSPSDINCLVMLSADAYWTANDYDKIYKTFDGGESWVEQPSTGPSGFFLVGIDNYYSQTALIVGQSATFENAGKIIKTTDGGNHWYLRHASPSRLWKVSYAKN